MSRERACATEHRRSLPGGASAQADSRRSPPGSVSAQANCRRSLLGGASAFTVVLTEMVAVAAVSGLILILAYGPYSRGILWLAGHATRSQRNLGVFLAAIVAVPAVLLLI